jgi:hypothetical protein
MILPTTLDSLLPFRSFLLQLFKPVQHDVDLRQGHLRLLEELEHQEALAVSRDNVSRERSCSQSCVSGSVILTATRWPPVESRMFRSAFAGVAMGCSVPLRVTHTSLRWQP